MRLHAPLTLLRAWVVVAIAVTLVCGIMYVAVQHQIRTAANDPQIGMAQTYAAAMAGGASASNLLGNGLPIDVAKNMSPFAVVYDDANRVLASSIQLDGITPVLPSGVFDYTLAHGEDRLTWQPEPGVRLAIVVQRYNGSAKGFVLVGRSLTEVETREGDLGVGVLVGWLVTLTLTLAAAYVLTIEREVRPEASSR